MELNKDLNGDFISSCKSFKIARVCDDKYLPMMRLGDGQDNPVIYAAVTDDEVSLFEAMKILNNY